VIRVTFLGTAASRPTVGRNAAALAVQREGDLMLFDCGEGTQRQMMRYATGFGMGAIFVTHLHADHILGITGLLRTLGLQGREEALELYGPPGSKATLDVLVRLGSERIPFEVPIRELAPGEAVRRAGYRIAAYAVDPWQALQWTSERCTRLSPSAQAILYQRLPMRMACVAPCWRPTRSTSPIRSWRRPAFTSRRCWRVLGSRTLPASGRFPTVQPPWRRLRARPRPTRSAARR
jgi:hypothetical protein